MKGCLQTILIFALSVVVINTIMTLVESKDKTETVEVLEVNPLCEESVRTDEFGNREHRRFWGFYEQPDGNCMAYQTLESSRSIQESKRLELDISWSKKSFWGSLYRKLVQQTGTEMDYLADSLINVGLSRGYSRMDLARLTVSFVQDIPYAYVLPMPCDEYETHDKPCAGQEPYGIVSPYEFAHSLNGDCDTRAVLLYVLLAKMNFSPMIVVSEEYAHAMLALRLPAQGDYILHKGDKYYFWETTATGWSIGMLPPDTNNIAYWKIALVNES